MSRVPVDCGVMVKFSEDTYEDARLLAGPGGDAPEPGEEWCELPTGHEDFSKECYAFLCSSTGGGVWAKWDREATDLVVRLTVLPNCPADSGDPESVHTETCTLFEGHACKHSWEFERA